MLDGAELHVLASPGLLAVVLFIVFVAAIVQFQLGMGFGLLAAPLLAVLDPELVPASTLMIGLATSSLGAWRERHAIAWNEVGTGILGRFAGVAVAAVLLANLPDRGAFSLVFGVMIGLAVLLSVVGLRLRFDGANLLAMSTLSGLMGTITSVGAPPLAIIYQDRPPGTARPTLAAFFALGCLISLIGLWLSGWAGPRDLLLAAVMAPGMLLGYAASRRLEFPGAARRYRAALLAVSGVAAVVLMIRGLA